MGSEGIVLPLSPAGYEGTHALQDAMLFFEPKRAGTSRSGCRAIPWPMHRTDLSPPTLLTTFHEAEGKGKSDLRPCLCLPKICLKYESHKTLYV